MNISNLGRLIGAGLLALGLHAIAFDAEVGDAERLDAGAVKGDHRAAASSRTFEGALVGAQATLSPADGKRATESPE